MITGGALSEFTDKYAALDVIEPLPVEISTV
jgi:hypothetical protein